MSNPRVEKFDALVQHCKEQEMAQAPSTILGQPIQVMQWEPGMIMIVSFPHRLEEETYERLGSLFGPLMKRHGIARGDIIVLEDGAKIDLVKREDIK